MATKTRRKEQEPEPETLLEAMAHSGITEVELAYRLDVSTSSVANWRKRQNTPSHASRKKMAALFGRPLAMVNSWFTRRQEAA